MENREEIIQMAIAAATGDIPAEFSMSDVEATLREQLSAFNDMKYFRKHEVELYEMIEEIADIIVPRKVLEQFGPFSEITRKAYGEKISFTLRTGKFRGKKFVTIAGDQGIYKTFTLDNRELVMNPVVYAGAARLEIHDFLLGRISMAELMDILIEALNEKLYMEVQNALKASFNAPNRPAANKHTAAGFVAKEFDRLINTVRAYGDTVNIYCTYAFASNIMNSPQWATSGKLTTDRDYDDVREMGYVGKYKGCNVIILAQSFTDDTNTETLVDDQFCYIMPAGKEAPVKIAMEGNTFVRRHEDSVGSMEVSIEQMFDVAVINNNYWAIYQDTTL